MPLGRKVGLDPSNIVLDGDPAPPPQKGGRASNFRPTSIVAKRLQGSRCHLVWRYALAQTIVLDGDPDLPPQKGDTSPKFRPMSVVAKRLDGS